MKRFRVLGLGLSLAVLGCASSTGESAATQTACNDWCVAYAAAAFPSDGSTGCATPFFHTNGTGNPQADQATEASSCVAAECGPLRGGSANCQTVFTRYYECERSQADLCADNGCTNEFAALDHC